MAIAELAELCRTEAWHHPPLAGQFQQAAETLMPASQHGPHPEGRHRRAGGASRGRVVLVASTPAGRQSLKRAGSGLLLVRLKGVQPGKAFSAKDMCPAARPFALRLPGACPRGSMPQAGAAGVRRWTIAARGIDCFVGLGGVAMGPARHPL